MLVGAQGLLVPMQQGQGTAPGQCAAGDEALVSPGFGQAQGLLLPAGQVVPAGGANEVILTGDDQVEEAVGRGVVGQVEEVEQGGTARVQRGHGLLRQPRDLLLPGRLVGFQQVAAHVRGQALHHLSRLCIPALQQASQFAPAFQLAHGVQAAGVLPHVIQHPVQRGAQQRVAVRVFREAAPRLRAGQGGQVVCPNAVLLHRVHQVQVEEFRARLGKGIGRHPLGEHALPDVVGHRLGKEAQSQERAAGLGPSQVQGGVEEVGEEVARASAAQGIRGLGQGGVAPARDLGHGQAHGQGVAAHRGKEGRGILGRALHAAQHQVLVEEAHRVS